MVRGRVLQVRSGVVMLDLGYKSDGIIPVEQFTEEELKALKPGDELEVMLEAAEDSNGNLLLSREKAKKLQVWDHLNQAYQTGAPVKGKVRLDDQGRADRRYRRASLPSCPDPRSTSSPCITSIPSSARSST